MTSIIASTTNSNNSVKSLDFSKMSEAELRKGLIDASQQKLIDNELINNYLEALKKIDNKGNDTERSLSEQINEIIKSSNITKERKKQVKEILEKHLQNYNHKNETIIRKKESVVATKSLVIDDLKAKLNETQQKYDELLNADEKLVTPREYVRRQRLRSVKKKFLEIRDGNINKNKTGDTKKALAYFLTKTSIWKGGKVTSAIKRGNLFFKSLSSFSTMGVEQIVKIKKQIQEAVDELKPKEKDTITIKHLKSSIIEEVAKAANSYFAEITKPIDTKIAA